MRRMTTRLVLPLVAALTVATLAACGGDADGSAAPSDPPATETSDPTTAPAEPTTEPTPTEEPVPEITVAVGPLADGNEYTEQMYVEYTAFEDALWATLASGEITAEMRELAGPDVIIGLEQTLLDQPRPLGGTVAVTATLDDITVADLGAGPMASDVSLVGCSDQSQVEFAEGTGGLSGFTANVVFDLDAPRGYVVQEYILDAEVGC